MFGHIPHAWRNRDDMILSYTACDFVNFCGEAGPPPGRTAPWYAGYTDEACCGTAMCAQNVAGPQPDFPCWEPMHLKPAAGQIVAYSQEECCDPDMCSGNANEGDDHICALGSLSPTASQVVGHDDPGCCFADMCDDGEMFDTSTGACVRCPFPDRCIHGACKTGTAGPGCGSCDLECTGPLCEAQKYFQVGQRCMPCAEGMQVPLLVGGVTALVIFLGGFWHITMVDTSSKDPGEASKRDKLDDANVFGDGNAATARSVAQASSSVSDTAIFLSISLPHIQFISLSLLLPFGWPEFLSKIGSYISSLVSIDFGCVCSLMPSTLEDLTKQLESGWSLLLSALWRPMLTRCTWASSC